MTGESSVILESQPCHLVKRRDLAIETLWDLRRGEAGGVDALRLKSTSCF